MKIIQPEGFAPPRGYVNGIVSSGPILYIAGQVGWQADQTFVSDDFCEQFGQALDNVMAVVTAAGAEATDIIEMTVYVTDIDEYRQAVHDRKLGPVWRERLGKHLPAMALVAVASLVEARAKVEIQGRAVVPKDTK